MLAMREEQSLAQPYTPTLLNTVSFMLLGVPLIVAR